MGMIDELTKAGWVRFGDHSRYWKSPDDTGPSGKKWTVGPAHTEMLVRKASAPKPAPRAKTTSTKKKSTTAKKAD